MWYRKFWLMMTTFCMSLMLFYLYSLHPLHQVLACCPASEGVTEQYALLCKVPQCIKEALQYAQAV